MHNVDIMHIAIYVINICIIMAKGDVLVGSSRIIYYCKKDHTIL